MSLSDMEERLREARFAHPSDEELAAYSAGEVGTATSARVKMHLGLCLICEHRSAVLREESLHLAGRAPAAGEGAVVDHSAPDSRGHTSAPEAHIVVPATASQPAELWARLAVALRRIALIQDISAWARPNDAYLLAAEGGQNWEYGQTEDGNLRWSVGEDREGNHHVTVASPVEAFEGRRLRLKAGDWQRELLLRRVAAGQVGAEAVIPREEIDVMPAGAALYLESLDDGEGGDGG